METRTAPGGGVEEATEAAPEEGTTATVTEEVETEEAGTTATVIEAEEVVVVGTEETAVATGVVEATATTTAIATPVGVAAGGAVEAAREEPVQVGTAVVGVAHRAGGTGIPAETDRRPRRLPQLHPRGNGPAYSSSSGVVWVSLPGPRHRQIRRTRPHPSSRN